MADEMCFAVDLKTGLSCDLYKNHSGLHQWLVRNDYGDSHGTFATDTPPIAPPESVARETVTWRVDAEDGYICEFRTEAEARKYLSGEPMQMWRKLVEVTTTERVVAERKAGA